MTFRLALPSGEIAIRVNTGSKRTLVQVRGEVAWTQALHEEGKVQAPQPLSIFEGAPIATIRVEGIEREVPVVAFSWLPGRHVGKHRPIRSAFLLGRLMSDLHAMTRRWRLPAGTSRPVLKSALDELEWTLRETGAMAEVRNRADEVIARQPAAARQLVHFDLHFGNVKVHRGEMSVFDFDDSVVTTPGIDAAQAIFYLRRDGLDDPREAAFWQGAATSAEELGLPDQDFEMLVGGRGVLLAADLAQTTSASLIKMRDPYLRMTERRCEHLLKTGRFDPSVAKMSD